MQRPSVSWQALAVLRGRALTTYTDGGHRPRPGRVPEPTKGIDPGEQNSESCKGLTQVVRGAISKQVCEKN